MQGFFGTMPCMVWSLSKHAKEVMHRRDIRETWVYRVIDNPSVNIRVSDRERHYYGAIRERGNRCLKVVVNPLKGLIVTAYFDRGMRKKGCKDDNTIR